MSWIQLISRQTVRTLDTTVEYVVQLEIVAARGIERELFVRRRDDGAFSHVATVFDLEKFPNDRARAEADGVDFYRNTTVEYVGAAAGPVLEAAADAQLRLRAVNNIWGRAQNFQFGLETTIVLDSSVP